MPGIGIGLGLSLGGGAGGTAAVTKRVTLPFGADGTSSSNTLTRAVGRVVIAVPRATTRWRLRGSNWNARDNIRAAGAISYAGFFVGDPAYPTGGVWAGACAASLARALPGFAAPVDGSEWVSGWVTDPALQFAAGIARVLSWRQDLASGTVVNAFGNGGLCFYAPSDGAESGAAAPGGGSTNGVYGEFRLECEYLAPAGDKVVLCVGDSITKGTLEPYGQLAGPAPHETWPGRAARRSGFVAINAGVGSSTLAQWAGALTDFRWASLDLATTVPDAAIVALGTNDFGGGNLAAMQASFAGVCANLRALGIRQLHAATLIPYQRGNNGAEATRTAFNAWLRSLPFGLVDVFDFDGAMRLPQSPALPDPDVMDGGANVIHPKLPGLGRMAQMVSIR